MWVDGVVQGWCRVVKLGVVVDGVQQKAKVDNNRAL